MSQQRRASNCRDVHGVLLLDKPVGISSNRALQQVKRLYRARKAGHTGNLDLQADGLLPVCFGEATKLCAFLLEADKFYRSEFKLGEATVTGDAEGAVTFRGSAAGIDLDQVREIGRKFVGEIEQVPPMHSALKYNGQPLYKLAHRGIEVKRTPRRIRIFTLQIRFLNDSVLGVDVCCSKGTYIRTLADDIGKALGCGAHVTSLRRLRVGAFDVEHAVSIERLTEIADAGERALDDLLLPPDAVVETNPALVLTEDAAFYLKRGQAILVPRAPAAGLVRLYDSTRTFLGIGEVRGNGLIAPKRLMRIAEV